jgi:lycopene beta-cyclase
VVGGNHVWSFFDGDVADSDRWLVDPLVCHHWDGYDVAFPGHRRTLDQGYNSIESERFDAVVRAALPADAIIAGRVAAIDAGGVTLEDGGRIAATAVIDARGPGDLSHLDLGWQKFVGQLLHLDAPHGLIRPVVMDATVEQIDGYRFVYLLPFDATTIFVEDTYYSDSPALDVAAVKARIAYYALARGWRATAANRIETGVLPVVVAGDFDAYWNSTGTEVAKAGMRAGLFHPTTGYSLPDAVRLATLIAEAPDHSGRALAKLIRNHARRTWRGRGFYRLLDVMLFRAAFPMERYRIMERFYRLDAGMIGRFYAARSSLRDRMRILVGRPPIPIPRALRAIAKGWK